jgi:hypothetical protein
MCTKRTPLLQGWLTPVHPKNLDLGFLDLITLDLITLDLITLDLIILDLIIWNWSIWNGTVSTHSTVYQVYLAYAPPQGVLDTRAPRGLGRNSHFCFFSHFISITTISNSIGNEVLCHFDLEYFHFHHCSYREYTEYTEYVYYVYQAYAPPPGVTDARAPEEFRSDHFRSDHLLDSEQKT